MRTPQDIYKRAALALYDELEKLVKNKDLTEDEVYEIFLCIATDIVSEAKAEILFLQIMEGMKD